MNFLVSIKTTNTWPYLSCLSLCLFPLRLVVSLIYPPVSSCGSSPVTPSLLKMMSVLTLDLEWLMNLDDLWVHGLASLKPAGLRSTYPQYIHHRHKQPLGPPETLLEHVPINGDVKVPEFSVTSVHGFEIPKQRCQCVNCGNSIPCLEATSVVPEAVRWSHLR